MKYVGSKHKIAKYILPIILEGRQPGQWYVEPFVGGSNMIDKVAGPRLGNDIDGNLIAMFKALQGGWVPPTDVSREEYYAIKASPGDYPPHLVCFVSLLCSFGGKLWGGYAYSEKTGRNYTAEGARNLLKQAPNIRDVVYTNQNYWSVNYPADAIIYCDPPYKDTVAYSKDPFDHDKFWQWVRHMSNFHRVYVSEYQAPPDFKCIWEGEVTTTMNKNAKDKRVERLFVTGT